MLLTGIKLSEYQNRRKKLCKALKGAAAVVFSGGEGPPPLLGRLEADPNFFYLTGMKYESGAAVFLDPGAEDPKRRCILLLKPLNRERERWDGYRHEIGEAIRKETGFETVMRMGMLPQLLTQAARRAKKLACLHPFSVYDSPVSKDLAVFRKVSERIPGIQIADRTALFRDMRAVKSRAELALIKKAIRATGQGYAEIMKVLRPGVGEKTLEQAIDRAYGDCGARRIAFNSIVGAGVNGTVLHYMDNDGVAQDGDLVVIDSGADVGGYAADVTRTLPVSGTFTREQKYFYNLVLKAQAAAIRAVRPGATPVAMNEAARAVIEKAGYGDAFCHGTGHHLGIEVHDITPDGKYKPGMVTTVEPGIYLPELKMGIRIEDDVLVTAKGRTNLTSAIPRSVDDIEAAIKKARKARRG